MTELIEKEKAFKALSKYYHHKTPTQNRALEDALNHVPVEQAIPLDWLEHQRTMCYPGSERELFLRRLISDWKQEQNR